MVSTVNNLAATNVPVAVFNLISGLQPGTTYHFQVVAVNYAGTTTGADLTFTTGPAGPAVSSFVATVTATNGINGERSVQLSAIVYPNGVTTTAFFEYGLTTAYPGTNNFTGIFSVTNLSTTLAFSAGSSYHWRVLVTNALGSAVSSDQTFWLGSSALAGDLNGDGVVSQDELDAVYANYVTNSPWLYLTNVAGLGGTNVSFALPNSTLGSYSVQYSTDLVNWFYLGPASPRYLFTDTNAPAVPQRYYRLTYP